MTTHSIVITALALTPLLAQVAEIDPFAAPAGPPAELSDDDIWSQQSEPARIDPVIFPELEAIDIEKGETLAQVVAKITAALPESSRPHFRYDLNDEDRQLKVREELRLRKIPIEVLFKYLADISALHAEYSTGSWRITIKPPNGLVSHYYWLTHEDLELLGWTIDGEVVLGKEGRPLSETSGSYTKVARANPSGSRVVLIVHETFEGHRLLDARLRVARLERDN